MKVSLLDISSSNMKQGPNVGLGPNSMWNVPFSEWCQCPVYMCVNVLFVFTPGYIFKCLICLYVTGESTVLPSAAGSSGWPQGLLLGNVSTQKNTRYGKIPQIMQTPPSGGVRNYTSRTKGNLKKPTWVTLT